MGGVRRLNRTDAEYLAMEPQFLSISLLRFAQRPDGTVPTAAEIAGRCGDVITRVDAHEVFELCKQRVRPMPGRLGPPFWEDDPDFDINRHIYPHPRKGPFPVEEMGALMADATSRPFDLAHPLWRLEIIDSFDDGSFGILATHHHAIADGTSAYLALALAAFDFGPETPELPPAAGRWSPLPVMSANELALLALRQGLDGAVRGARRAIETARRLNVATVSADVARVAAYLRDEPPVNRRPARQQTLESRRDWRVHPFRLSLLDLRLATRSLGVTVTDLFLAAAAAAWSEVEPESSAVWVLVPVNLRGSGEGTASNEVGFAVVDVPCGADILTTVRAASTNLDRAKRQEQPRTLVELGRIRSHLPAPLQNVHWGRIDRPDVIVSNMPGYPFPIYCQGAKLCDALATSSLAAPSYSKMTFITFEDVCYGTMIEDSGPDDTGPRMAARFEEELRRLFSIGMTRSLLARQLHLSALSPTDLDRLTRAAQVVTFDAGMTVVEIGEEADSYFVVQSGQAEVAVEGAPARVLGTGDSFGEVGLVRGGTRSATVKALEPLEVLRIEKADFLSAFHGDLVNIRPLQTIIDHYADLAPSPTADEVVSPS